MQKRKEKTPLIAEQAKRQKATEKENLSAGHGVQKMKIRKRKRLPGMNVSLNQCYNCGEFRMCPYEIFRGSWFPICKDCAEKKVI